MGKEESYESRVEKYLFSPMEEHGLELIDVEYVKGAGTWYLRAYMDKEGGIVVDDRETISGALSSQLGREDFIDNSYILEVSSPGLGCLLRKRKDFVRSIGKGVGIRFYRQLSKQEGFTDALSAYGENTVTLTMEDGSQMVFEEADIALMRLALDFQLDRSHAET